MNTEILDIKEYDPCSNDLVLPLKANAIDGIGHICYDCQKEFQEVMGEDAELSEQHMYEQLKAFMATEPRHPHGGSEQVTVSQFFNKYKRE